MKRSYFLLICLFGFFTAQAQNAATVVFAENGELFTLYLNGVKQNETPQSNVQLNELSSEFYQARVDFEDPAFPDFSNKNFAVMKGFLVTYMIKVNRKGEYVLRYQSETEMDMAVSAPAPPAPPRPTSVPVQETEVQDAEIAVEMTAPSTGTTRTTTTSTTTINTPGSEDKVKIDLKVPGVDVTFDVDMGMDMGMDMGVDMGVEIREETSVTTTTSTTQTQAQPRMTTATWVDQEPEEIVVNCAVSPSEFTRMKGAIESKTFSDSKMTTAKQATKNKCLTCEQIKEIMLLFTFEGDKLEFAQYAYDKAMDPDSYYIVYDAFEFESSIDDLNEYIEMR